MDPGAHAPTGQARSCGIFGSRWNIRADKGRLIPWNDERLLGIQTGAPRPSARQDGREGMFGTIVSSSSVVFL
jgi:hypothetical protein